jgi:two-component system, NarL family, sensor kinase
MTAATTSLPQRRPSLPTRVLATIPPEPSAPPVRYTAPLVAYVTAVCALALVVALLTVRAPSDVAAVVFGAAVIFALVLVMVRSFGGVSAPWSPTAFVHLALSFAYGPVGALAAAVAAAVAMAVRLRTGWFRATLNLANFFLVNVAAYAVFHALTRTAGAHLWIVALVGFCAGAVAYAVNSAVLCGAIPLASGVPVLTFLRSTIGVIPYELAYGLGAAGFALYSVKGGSPYLVMWLAPVVSIQGFLVMLAVRTNAHAADRERLLQRIVTGEQDHRAKSAADLHDGPVAALVGIRMLLSSIAADLTPDAQRKINEATEELQRMQHDLRTHIFNLSPHGLDKPGRLREEVTTNQLRALHEHGVDVDVAIPDVVPLDRPALELVHRVCGEVLANIARHARATHVAIALAVEGAEVVLTIDDDGQGFSPADVKRRRSEGHFGTRFLAEKAEVAHGTFTIHSAPGKGTRARLSLPFAPASPQAP